jgi:hypothetical protein
VPRPPFLFEPGPRLRAALVLAALAAAGLRADPLSKQTDIDFFRDVASRDLHGFVARSDGRLVAGPVLAPLAGAAPAELLWCLEPGADGRWLIGTGPDGRIFEATADLAQRRYTVREVAKLDERQVFALRRLPNGEILAGTSPQGGLVLLRGGRTVARAGLPADSIFDLLLLPAAGGPGFALAATGNPGRIYRVDLAKFAAGGAAAGRLDDAAALAAHGISLFGEIRDRNVRRIVLLADGRVAAGSSPAGNVYAFPAGGGPPVIVEENHDAEVTDLLPQPNGDLFATLIFGGGASEQRAAGEKPKEQADLPPPALPEKFGGRSVLMRFPADGFPELLTARNGKAFYRLAREGRLLVLAGGEEGDLAAYDLDSRLAFDFPGSESARLNGLAAVPGSPGRYLVLGNNAPGLALLDFGAALPRSAETGAVDLGVPAELGALRVDRLRNVDEKDLKFEIRTSNGSDEREGWTDWTTLRSSGDGWRADHLRGRYVKIRISAPAGANLAQLDHATLYYLPQNHPPKLQDFHLLSPNFELVVPPESPPPAVTTLAQVLQGKDDSQRKDRLLGAQVVPSPGTQTVFWTVSDPDGDNLVCTFSIRRDGEPNWTDIAVDTRESYAAFDTSHLPDGVYFTRLVAKETAPRPAADRLSATFETDDLVIDHTPPQILAATASRVGDQFVVSVHGRDALSLLDGLELTFNNGDHAEVEQPADGIRDGREETFIWEEPVARAAGATSVEATLYDAAGNGATQRVALPR